MKVRVRLIGRFTETLGFTEKDLSFRGPVTAAGLARRLCLDKVEHVATREGRPLADGDPLEDGDRVVVAPVFSGG
ncbi:MAG: hypothetical protein WC943_03610 [Elusimicrobiota bacterium]